MQNITNLIKGGPEPKILEALALSAATLPLALKHKARIGETCMEIRKAASLWEQWDAIDGDTSVEALNRIEVNASDCVIALTHINKSLSPL